MNVTMDMLDAALRECVSSGLLTEDEAWESDKKRDQILEVIQVALDAHPVLSQIEELSTRDISVSIKASLRTSR